MRKQNELHQYVVGKYRANLGTRHNSLWKPNQNKNCNQQVTIVFLDHFDFYHKPVGVTAQEATFMVFLTQTPFYPDSFISQNYIADGEQDGSHGAGHVLGLAQLQVQLRVCTGTN